MESFFKQRSNAICLYWNRNIVLHTHIYTHKCYLCSVYNTFHIKKALQLIFTIHMYIRRNTSNQN